MLTSNLITHKKKKKSVSETVETPNVWEKKIMLTSNYINKLLELTFVNSVTIVLHHETYSSLIGTIRGTHLEQVW